MPTITRVHTLLDGIPLGIAANLMQKDLSTSTSS